MRFLAIATALWIAAAQDANAALIDTFTRTDLSPLTDSLSSTESGGFDYVERGNTASQSIPVGTAEVTGGSQLLITGSNQTIAPVSSSNTGGAYLSGSDFPSVQVGC